MSDDSATFTIDIPVNAPGVDAAASAIERLQAQLDAASKAALAASDAVKAGEASYSAAQRSADNAAKALERIGIAAEAQRGKLQAAMDAGDMKGAERAASTLQNLIQRQAEAAAKAQAAKTALDAQAASLDKLQAEAKKASDAEEALTKELAAAEKSEKNDSKAEESVGEGFKFEGLERGLNKLGGPLGTFGAKIAGLGSGYDKLQKSLGDSAPEVIAAVGIAAVGAALVAAAAAAVVAIAKIAEWAIGLADANRNALLLSQGITRSIAGGTALNGEINSLTKTLPLTQEELQGMAQNLANSGLRGQALSTALDRAATNAARLKFGPDFAKEMLSLDQQSKVFQANIAQVFGGLKTDALMEGLQKLIALFDQNTASGKALKALFESLFQPLVDWVAKQAPKIERFFLQLEVWVMKGMLMIKPYGSTIGKVLEALAIGIGAVVAVVALFAAGVVMAIGAILVVIGGLVAGVVWLGVEFVKAQTAVANFFKGLDLGAMGKNLIDGLVNGIKNGATAVLNAMKGVVQGAIDGAKKLLGIASPSKVFAEIGMQTGAGMQGGVEKSAGGVQGALESMVSPPLASAGKGGAMPAGGGAGAKGSHTFQIIINGVAGAEEAVQQIVESVTRILEGDTSQVGAVAPG